MLRFAFLSRCSKPLFHSQRLLSSHLSQGSVKSETRYWASTSSFELIFGRRYSDLRAAGRVGPGTWWADDSGSWVSSPSWVVMCTLEASSLPVNGPGGKSPLGPLRSPGTPAKLSDFSLGHKMKPGFSCLLVVLGLLHSAIMSVWGVTTTFPSFPTPVSFPTSNFSSSYAPDSAWSTSSSKSQVRRPQSLRTAFCPFLWLFGDLNIISRMGSPEHSKRFTTPFVNCRCLENELKPRVK